MPGPKKAQRTKGNVKPSSSSQAAQLLAASGHAPTGFIGFSNQPAFVPVSETFDEAESALDGDFRLVLRKLSKRDTVTKIKALQEFSSLCSTKDEATVKAIVPFWPRIYNKVAIDVDHKVRELSQRATASLASQTGKAMAPHLKSIMGMWMVSMCDTYPTVASAANQAFISRFPGAKQAEAIRFCLEEIVECLLKNIMSHNKQTLSDPQTTSDEDMEAKYQRVITSSLQGLRKVLDMLPSDSVSARMTDHMTTLLGSSTFWKHAKSHVPSVKGGMLSLLSAVCLRCPAASGGAISKISPFVFSYLDCAEPSVVSYAWEAALSVVSAHEDCWQHVNWQKAVWPKLKSVLESGCSGQAGIVAPCLMPLLSKIPEISFTRFFESFRLGVIEDSVLNSPSELNAMVKSLQECMQYAVKRLASEEKTTEIRDLVLDQMLTVVQGSLTEPKASLSRTELYSNLNVLLSSVADTNNDIGKCFWSDLSAFTIGRLQVEFEMAKKLNQPLHATSLELFERLKFLMRGLIFQESASSAGKRERVKFGGAKEASMTKSFKLEANMRKKEKAKLCTFADAFVGDIIVAAFKMATVEERAMTQFISLFSQLVVMDVPMTAVKRLNSQADSVSIRIMEDLDVEPGICLTRDTGKGVISKLESQLSLSSIGDTGSADYYKHFVVRHLIPLMFYAESKHSEQLKCSAVMSFFAFLHHMEDAAALEILSTIIEDISEPFMMCQLIENTFLMSKAIPACQKLTEQATFAEHVEKLTLGAAGGQDSVAETSTNVWRMLTSVISSMDDLTLSQPCLDAVMSSCVSTLNQLVKDSSTSKSSQEIRSLVSVVGLVEALLSKQSILTHSLLGELVINLLPIVLQTQLTEKGNVPDLEQLWLKGIGLILSNKSDVEIQNLLCRMCSIIQDSVTSTDNALDSLICIKRVTKLLMSSMVLPWDENADRNDVQSRLSFLSLDPDMEVKDVDLPAISAIVDNLFIKDAPQLQNYKNICKYMYISGGSQTLVNGLESDAGRNFHRSEHTEAMSSLYNLSVLEMFMELSQMIDSREKSNMDTCPVSDAQILCLQCLCGKFVLLSAATKMKRCQFPELSTCVSDLRSGLVRCLNKLTSDQLGKLVNSILIEDSSEHTALEVLGITQLLQFMIQEGLISRKRSDMLEKSMFKLRTSFVNRCLLPEAVVSDVLKLFEDSIMTEGSICKAFTMVSNEILGCEDESVKIKSMTLCLSGFMSLASEYNLLNDNVRGQFFQQLMEIINRLKDESIHLLNSSDTMPVPHRLLELNVSIAKALKYMSVASSDQYWEFTLCTLVEWIQFLSESEEHLFQDAHLQALAVSAFELSFEAAHAFSIISVEGETSSDLSSPGITEKARTEWNEFFAEGVFSPLLPMFVSLALPSEKWNSSILILIQAPLSSAVSLCPGWLVLAHQLPPHLTASDNSSLPDSLKTLLNHLCPLLMSQERCVEVASYLILRTVVEEMAKQHLGEGESATGGKEEEEEMKSPPEALMVQMEAAGHFLEVLKVVQVDNHIVMDPYTEERSQAMGYLLAWRLLLFLFKSAKDELRAKYAQYFKTQASVSHLLDHLFRLMPQYPDPEVIECGTELTVKVNDKDRSNLELEWLALQVYRGCLEIVPALVRAWWVEQDRKSSNFVDHFTTQYLSTGLIWQQITSAQGKDDCGVEGITIKTRPATREVLATYEMAEVTVNMTITLPENFPLGKLAVACDKRVGVSQAQWDRWLLQLNIFLQHQNGSIMEGLRLWKGNIDKKFEGLDDCMICFSVIHGTTFQLPRLSCRTCRKKFHSTCLYKWFSTSQKSSCPLCRNLF